ncbi:aminoglycoside phosphotransferase family protein [Clostridium folliculivorans]|uniref:Aminoglycoside phosphotransferase n=1 Tax=Clostridium folliculivorans TaxID=2886038 RepID=A0A9W6DAR6_9CLOT|nr:phosphotransferase [Clostridium folliculivorans]GKU25246.1 aminoglycoside phosphotransferase [Clostridium folliculivorans]GKU28267.1 aminoglycoside phosphotransferase [Clostridium folliculivorans]
MEIKKIIGIGNTATVYQWEDDRVLKLFHKGYSKDAIEREFHNAKSVEDMSFEKPKAYEILDLGEQTGIIYDKVEGESLLQWVIKTGNVQQCAVIMAKLHKKMGQNKVSDVPNYKDFLRENIVNISSLKTTEQQKALSILDMLPEGNTFCHGDFHPDNILISNEHAIVIDFMNICHGDFLYDVARTVFLVEYTPVPTNAGNREQLLEFKKALADLYLSEMEVTREMIQDYLSVIILARKGECPNE